MPRKISFAPAADDRFRAVLQTRVDTYFREHNLSKHWDWRMLLKVVTNLGLYAATYAWLVTQDYGIRGHVAGMAVLGVCIATIGFNVGHDAAHGGFSETPWVNAIIAHSFTLVGVHVYTWKILHNVIHHTYTNIPHADGDLNTVPWLRFFANGKARPSHRFQHIYCFGLYSLASLVWVFSKDYVHMNRKVHCTYTKPVPPAHEWALLYGGKLLHYVLFLGVPWLALALPLWQVLLSFVLMHLVAGSIIANVFTVGHLVDSVRIVDADAQGRVADSWFAHQLRTTANFNTNSAFFFWTVGGLNFQVEHHLFPKICHVHYRALAPIVEQAAREFGLPYHNYPTLRGAVSAHRRFLKQLGQAAA